MATTTYFPGSASSTEAPSLPSKLHDWIVTVDHKRLGIMLHRERPVFLRGGRGTCRTDADSVGVSQQHIPAARSLQSIADHAWNHHGVSGGYAVFRRAGELSHTPDDWHARYGVPEIERFWFLDVSLRRDIAVLQLYSWRRIGRPRIRARCGLVRIRAPDRAGVLARDQHRLLDSQHHSRRYRHHGERDQRNRHDYLHAMQGNDLGPHASVRMVDAGGFVDGAFHYAAADRGTNYAPFGPVSGCALSSTRKPADLQSCGSTSSGCLDIPRSTF